MTVYNLIVIGMIGRFIVFIKRYYLKHFVYNQFTGATLDSVVLGTELNRNFQIRHPKNLKIGYKTVISGDLFINAWGRLSENLM